MVFGLADGLSLIALALLMIGICHLPIRMAWRVVLLVATGAFFAVWRIELLPAPWSLRDLADPGSMFMFRIALYTCTR